MKKKLTSIILFILITVIATNIYAAITANASLTSSKTKVKPGEEVTVKLKISEINAGDGLNGVQSKIDYNKDIFETLGESAVKGLNGLTAYYNESDEGNILVATIMSGIKDDKEFIEANFKVKENAPIGNASITFNEIEIFNLEKTNIGSKTVNIEIVNAEENNTTPTPTTKPTPTPTATPNGGSESTPTPSTKPGETNNTPTPTATAKPNNGENKNDIPVTNIDTNTSSGSGSTNKGNTSSGSSSSTSNKGKTTSSSSLPKAGIGSTIVVLTVVATVLGTVAYIKLRKYREI